MLRPINASTDDLRQFGIYESIAPLLLKLAMPTILQNSTLNYVSTGKQKKKGGNC
jgi:hypothetical protein